MLFPFVHQILPMTEKPSRYGTLWNREELILAFELYCRIPFPKTKASNPEVRALAARLNRSPASVARKLGNFGALDPELQRRSISGLGHTSTLDRQIWDEFHKNWNQLVVEADKLRDSIPHTESQSLAKKIKYPTGPSEKTVTRKDRVHQSFFRSTVLSSYLNTCCVTGITFPECLVAAHIVPWSSEAKYRTDPTNGICLSATFDRLFDRGLMMIDDELCISFSKRMRKTASKSDLEQILAFNGKPIIRPQRFLPSLTHLAWHRKNVFMP